MPKQLALSDIQALGFDVEEIYPRIFKIRNFLTADEVSAIFQEVQSYTEDDWKFRYLQEMRHAAMEKFGRDDIEQLVEEGLLEVTWNFADKNTEFKNHKLAAELTQRSQQMFEHLEGGLKVNGFMVVHRLYEGTELLSHYDQYSDKLIEYAGVLYINDDYTEGELFFKKIGISLTPEPGTLMVFPGTEEFEHGVHPVGAGPVRYNLPTFIKRSDPRGPMSGWANFG